MVSMASSRAETPRAITGISFAPLHGYLAPHYKRVDNGGDDDDCFWLAPGQPPDSEFSDPCHSICYDTGYEHIPTDVAIDSLFRQLDSMEAFAKELRDDPASSPLQVKITNNLLRRIGKALERV